MYRPSNATWYIVDSSNPAVFSQTQWGAANDVAVPGEVALVARERHFLESLAGYVSSVVMAIEITRLRRRKSRAIDI